MKNLDAISEDLFNKIRGRFPSVTIGNEDAEVTNDPKQARYFDFEYKEGDRKLGKVSISLDEKSIAVMYSNDFVANEDSMTQNNWYNFLKELRQFSKKRLLNFDTRNITKSNLDKRDYKFLAQTRAGEEQMTESTMYGTSRNSFQNIGNARVSIKHSQGVDQANPADRTRHISAIYVENADGERFKYPFKHLSGARAMARHVSEGGTPYDDFGSHITGLSEELGKLRKFKTYLGRSSVMAESLAGYVDIVKERMEAIKKDIKSLQKETFYKETVSNFEKPVFEEVPDSVKENWIDELTIRQFNEELKDVFPYIYRLVGEATKAKELAPEDLLGEAPVDDVEVGLPAETYRVQSGDTLYSIYIKFKDANFQGHDRDEAIQAIMDRNPDIRDPSRIRPGMIIQMPYFMGTGPDGASRGLPPGGFTAYEDSIESAFEAAMGQFSDHVCEECGNPSWTTLGMTEEEIEEGERHGNDSMYDKCWKGYRKVPGKKRGEKGSCKKVEGNAFAHAVRQAKMNGKKKGDKIDGPDGDEITLEKDGKTPLGEFILSYFDRESGQFPKGETAVLTMVEKDYGEQFINPAKQFIEQINNKVAEMYGYKDEEVEESGLQYHIGKKKYGKDGMAKLAQAGREGASQEELGRIKDQYEKESEDLRRLAGL